jgi:hypothetical protein
MHEVALLMALLCSPRQMSPELTTPDDWTWALDQPAELARGKRVEPGEWWFVAMPPGWHITMGPGGLLYPPGIEGRGRFVVESELFLFPDSAAAGVGLFLGGSGLDTAQNAYTSFEIRRDGSAGVFRHRGASSDPLVPWSPDTMPPHGGKEPEKHRLRIEVGADRVRFLVDDTPVADLAREAVAPEGWLGFRVGPDVNIHVVRLDLTYQLAPPRPPESDQARRQAQPRGTSDRP